MMNENNGFYVFLNAICEISKYEFDKSISLFELKTLKKSEIWVDYNKVCGEMAYINNGLLRTMYIDDKGNEVTSCFCLRNSMASSFKSFISQTPSHQRIEALENTDLLVIRYDSLQKLYRDVPVWERIGRILMEKEYVSLWNYAYSLNTEQAHDRYIRLIKNQPEVVQKAPVQSIASYLGISRETLSRIRKKIIQ